jgi:hypothetical protein
MSNWAVGLANGLGFGRRQKPWSELAGKSHRLPQEAAEPVKVGFESAFRNQTCTTQYDVMLTVVGSKWPAKLPQEITTCHGITTENYYKDKNDQIIP